MLRLNKPFSGDWPITQPYGPTSFAGEPPGNGYAHFHFGIDYGLDTQTPVLAAADGAVTLAGWAERIGYTGFGNMILLTHADGTHTLYAHLAAFAVSQGVMVRSGQVIGFSDSTGNSSGPHLHFGVKDVDTWVDPTPYFTYEPPKPPPPPPTEGPRYKVTTAMHFRADPSLGAPQGALLPVGTIVIKTTNPPKPYPAETAHWIFCRTGGDVRGYLYKPNLQVLE